MRIIKFRVWVFESDIKEGYMLDIYEKFEKDCNSDYYLVYEDFRDLEDGIAKYCIPLQFSGHFDKNGKEIYEGDIIQFLNEVGEKTLVVCQFGDAKRELKGNTINNCLITGFFYVFNEFKTFPIIINYAGISDYELFEVIGNIYEHSHLIDNN